MFTQITFDIPKKKSPFSTNHQVEGGEAAQFMGAKTDKDYARIIREFKIHTDAARRAYSFVKDAKARSKIALFLWKINDIRKKEQL